MRPVAERPITMERAVVEAISMGTITMMGVSVTVMRVPNATVVFRMGRFLMRAANAGAFVVTGTLAVGFLAPDASLGPGVLLGVRFGEVIWLFSSARQVHTWVYGRAAYLAEAPVGQKDPGTAWGHWREDWSLVF